MVKDTSMEFLLTIRKKFTAVDDPDGRAKARRYWAELGDPEGFEPKLQRLPEKAKPVKVDMKIESRSSDG